MKYETFNSNFLDLGYIRIIIVCPKIPIKLTEDTWNVFDLQGQTMIYPGTLSNINNNDPFHSNKIIPKISDF